MPEDEDGAVGHVGGVAPPPPAGGGSESPFAGESPFAAPPPFAAAPPFATASPFAAAPSAGASPFASASPFAQASPFGSYGAPPAASPPGGMVYELRPLSLGEVLDRTFSLYRKRFWLYAGLAAVAASITTLGTFVRLTWGLNPGSLAGPTDPRSLVISLVTSLVTLLLYFVAYSVTQAATVSAVNAAYLGRETSIGQSFKTVGRHWLRYIGIVIWQAFSSVWLPFVLLLVGGILIAALPGVPVLGGLVLVLAFFSLIYAVIAYIRNSLGIVASVVEDLGVRRAMRRSKDLVAGRKGRVFVLLLLMYVLNLVAGVVQVVFAALMVTTHSGVRAVLEVLTLGATFATGALVAPVGAIAFCVFYIDERVRREGYDVELLMGEGTGRTAPPPLGPFAGAPGSSPFGTPLGGMPGPATPLVSPFRAPVGGFATSTGVGAPPVAAADSPFSVPTVSHGFGSGTGSVTPPVKEEDSPFSAPLPAPAQEPETRE